VEVRTPERWTAGVYANGVGVWSTQTEFTLDFLVNLPPQAGTGTDKPLSLVEVVARLKLPPALIFQLLRNLSDALSKHEAQWGKIPDFKGPTFGRTELSPPSEEGES
jgi:hypothetical protein